MRQVVEAAESGNAQAQLAYDYFVHQIRHWIGAFWFQMGGCDALVFTAGIGENNYRLRARVCAGLEGMGIVLDEKASTEGPDERRLSASDSKVAVWTIPTNEELVVATEAYRFVAARTQQVSFN